MSDYPCPACGEIGSHFCRGREGKTWKMSSFDLDALAAKSQAADTEIARLRAALEKIQKEAGECAEAERCSPSGNAFEDIHGIAQDALNY